MSKYLIPLESWSAIEDRWVVDHRYIIGLTKSGPTIGKLPVELIKTKYLLALKGQIDLDFLFLICS